MAGRIDFRSVSLALGQSPLHWSVQTGGIGDGASELPLLGKI